MKKTATFKTRLLVKKIPAPFYDWQESYSELLNFEETSANHQWLSQELEFYFFLSPLEPDFFTSTGWIARPIFGPEIPQSELIFTYDLIAGEAMRHELPGSLFDFNWQRLQQEYQAAENKLVQSGLVASLSSTWRLKLINGEKFVMEFFTDNEQ